MVNRIATDSLISFLLCHDSFLLADVSKKAVDAKQENAISTSALLKINKKDDITEYML